MVDEKRTGEEVGGNWELERALALLKPAASQIDRDQFFYLAGRASVETVHPGSAFGRWMWPTATFVSSLAAVILLAMLLTTRFAPLGERPNSVPVTGEGSAVAAPRVSDGSSFKSRIAEPAESRIAEPASPANGMLTALLGGAPSAAQANSAQTLPSRAAARKLAEGANYPRLRSFVLAYGIDALPEPAPVQQSAADSRIDDEPRTQLELLRQTRSAGQIGIGRFGSSADSAG